MAEVAAEIEIPTPVADVWELYFDADRWRSWVDGFARVSVSDGYPERAGTLTWESTPAGRGRVSERVIEHDPRRIHRVEYKDPGSAGELETRFEMVPAEGEERKTKVSQKLTYELNEAGLFGAITDRLFIRSQMRRSLERSLAELRAEARADAGDGSTSTD